MATISLSPGRKSAGHRGGARATELPPLLRLIDASGRRWFLLGAMLLVVMGFAVWAAHCDPLAISGLFFAIAAILRTVPRIIEERARILREVEWQENVKACSSPAGDALATATATATSALTATATTAVDVTAAADPANTARA